MDQFVVGKLTEWGLERYIEVFKENEITKESFLLLTEMDIAHLIKPIGLRAKFRERLAALKREEESGEGGSAQPSTSSVPCRGKRKIDKLDPTSLKIKRQKRQELERKLEAVKNIMTEVSEKLPNNDRTDDFICFLRKLITGLKTERREVVGVFGRTGAGKSSLINTVIGEKDLLPTGIGRACTSVIIKVEANTKNLKYVVDVEFISEEEFEDLLWSARELVDNSDKKKKVDDEGKDITEKMTALFGTDWKIPLDKFKKSDKYKTISNLIKQKISLPFESSKDLSEQLKRYTKNIKDPSQTWYWPVVKCVTIKVPNNELLRHVTLVDLPGTGDCNKTRNDMWKEMVSRCGTVWVAAEVTRAASEREAWDILQSACRHLGNGGECRNIHFICTKSDAHLKHLSPEMLKEEISTKFKDLPQFQNHFPENCLKVFIVSTDEEKETTPEQNEISELEDFLQSLNDQEEQVRSYVSTAYSILALMQGARSGNAQQKTALYEHLSAIKNQQLRSIEEKMQTVYKDFDKKLTEGVNKAKEECDTILEDEITTKIRSNFKTFSSVMKKNGDHTTIKGVQINLNTTLSSFLTDSIDLEFRKTFPNSGKDGPFFGGTCVVSPDMEQLYVYEVVILLIFLQNEEMKLKAKLCKEIRERKKLIYNSPTETVKKMMKDGYKAAADYRTVREMKNTIMAHVQKKKDVMFDAAKRDMLEELKKLMDDTLKTIDDDLEKAMTLALKREVVSVPDIQEEFLKVKKYHEEN